MTGPGVGREVQGQLPAQERPWGRTWAKHVARGRPALPLCLRQARPRGRVHQMGRGAAVPPTSALSPGPEAEASETACVLSCLLHGVRRAWTSPVGFSQNIAGHGPEPSGAAFPSEAGETESGGKQLGNPEHQLGARIPSASPLAWAGSHPGSFARLPGVLPRLTGQQAGGLA